MVSSYYSHYHHCCAPFFLTLTCLDLCKAVDVRVQINSDHDLQADLTRVAMALAAGLMRPY